MTNNTNIRMNSDHKPVMVARPLNSSYKLQAIRFIFAAYRSGEILQHEANQKISNLITTLPHRVIGYLHVDGLTVIDEGGKTVSSLRGGDSLITDRLDDPAPGPEPKQTTQ